GIPLVIFMLSPSGNRRESAKIFAGALALVAITVAWAWWYFGVPVPLSFYIKSLATSFGEPFLARHTPEAREQFIRFLIDYSPLWAFAVLDLPSRWKARQDGVNALWLAVFAATLLHWMYYRFAVLQVVSSYQRFYYPTLPALFFLGATSLARVLAIGLAWAGKSKASRAVTGGDHQIKQVLVDLVLILACAAVSARAIRSSTFMWRSASANHQIARFDLDGRYSTPRAREMWRALDGFTGLGDELVLATTEVGLLAALNPRKQVIDLVGLNENRFARYGFDAHRLCAELKPDVLYLPHPDYTAMIAQIAADPTFQSDYDYCFPSLESDEGSVRLGIALRRASPNFTRLKELVAQRNAQDGDPAGAPPEVRKKQ
ncbi:MAG TPA: hypothetical protein VK843_18705, partial [Planctomycetota bacterium]|nr:hypothetical protein [Planctomycetota bacterium]